MNPLFFRSEKTSPMASFAVILPAAGKSSRFSDDSRRKKVFTELKGRAVWLRAAELFTGRNDIVQTLVVISPEDMEFFKLKFGPNLAFMDLELVEGGAERADSVENALQRVREDVDFVAVHDAARPLLAPEWIDAVFAAAEESGAAIPGVRISSTIKRTNAEKTIQETVPRDDLWTAQTPQVFRRELLIEAYAKRGDAQPTDEAQLVEQSGHPVRIVEGSPMNLKITTQDDFQMAKVLLDVLPKKTLGSLHPFSDEEPRSLL